MSIPTRTITAVALGSIVIVPAMARATSLLATEASQHIDEQASVCGIVASAVDAEQIRGEPIFLRLGHAYPQQDFSIIILGEAREAITAPTSLVGRRICATGRIQRFMGKPQITVTSLSQLAK